MTEIVEIGHGAYFKHLFPERTFFVALGASPEDDAIAGLVLRGPSDLARGTFLRLLRQVSAPTTSVIVCRIHHRPGRMWRALGLLLRIGALRRGAAPVVVLDFEDEDAIAPAHLPLLRVARLVFKREPPDPALLPADVAAKLRPLPLGLPLGAPATFPAQTAKRTDVFFSGHIWPGSPVRLAGRTELADLAARGTRLDLPNGRLPLAEFHARCAQAWLTWSPSGLGSDCFRHYEAAACGSVPVIDRTARGGHRWLRDGVHAIHYDPIPGGLRTAVVAALDQPERLRQMAAEGRALVLRSFTPAAIAGRIIEEATA